MLSVAQVHLIDLRYENEINLDSFSSREPSKTCEVMFRVLRSSINTGLPQVRQRGFAVGRSGKRSARPPPSKHALVPKEVEQPREIQPHRGEDGSGATFSYGALGGLGVLLATVGWFYSYQEWHRKNKKSESPMRSTDWTELSDMVRYAMSGEAGTSEVAGCSCPGCDGTLTGRGPFVTLEGRLWHPEHARCQRCAEDGTTPAGRLFVVARDEEVEAVCERDCQDVRETPYCAACSHGFDPEEQITVTDMGDVVCANHMVAARQCYCCRRPLVGSFSEGTTRHGDGRYVCRACGATSVDDPELASDMLERVRHMLATDFGIDTGGAALKVELGELDEGRRVYEKATGVQVGHVCIEGMTIQKHFALQTGAKLVQKREVQGIYLLRGMSAIHTAKVIAHELTHVYLAINKFHSLPLQVEEGICQLVSYLWLAEQVDRARDRTRSVPRRRGVGAHQDDGGPAPLDLIKNGEDLKQAVSQLRRIEADMGETYGLGFRKAHAALQGRPLADMLSYVKQHRPSSAPTRFFFLFIRLFI